MFAPWRTQKSKRKHKDPITGNLFIKYLTERGGIVLTGHTTFHLPNQKVMDISYTGPAFVFPFPVFRWKQTHSRVRHFCVIWQSSIQYKVARPTKNEI